MSHFKSSLCPIFLWVQPQGIQGLQQQGLRGGGCDQSWESVAVGGAGVAIKSLNLVSEAGQRKHRWWIELGRHRESRRLVCRENDPGSWQGVWDRGSRSLQESRLPSQSEHKLVSSYEALGETMVGRARTNSLGWYWTSGRKMNPGDCCLPHSVLVKHWATLLGLGCSFVTCLQFFFPLNRINMKQGCLHSSLFSPSILTVKIRIQDLIEFWCARVTSLQWMGRGEIQDNLELRRPKLFSVAGRIPGRTQWLFGCIR